MRGRCSVLSKDTQAEDQTCDIHIRSQVYLLLPYVDLIEFFYRWNNEDVFISQFDDEETEEDSHAERKKKIFSKECEYVFVNGWYFLGTRSLFFSLKTSLPSQKRKVFYFGCLVNIAKVFFNCINEPLSKNHE